MLVAKCALLFVASAVLLGSSDGFNSPSIDRTKPFYATAKQQNEIPSNSDRIMKANKISARCHGEGRRDALRLLSLLPLAGVTSSWAITPKPALAAAGKVTGPTDGNLDDLPPNAAQAYLQYRIPLQISADFYLFDLKDMTDDPNEWGAVGELFQANGARGGGNPNRIEREFSNVMRIIGLSMLPDIADEMRDSQFKFERAMAKVSKATGGVRRDLPVELDKNAIKDAQKGWDDGREALNEFLTTLNVATGLSEMKTVPPRGPNQIKDYGRNIRRYNDLKKKTKLCQNRGGAVLAQVWGGLMVSGYLQDSCGIPDLDEYFYQ